MIAGRTERERGDHGASDLTTAPARGVAEPEGARMSRTDKTRPWWVQMADEPTTAYWYRRCESRGYREWNRFRREERRRSRHEARRELRAHLW
jgi:hypothetical protein